MAERIKACVFDAYGTLFDVHSAVGRHAASVGPQADVMSRTWRLKQLEYSWTRSLMRRHADFWVLTGDALDYAMQSAGIADAALRETLMEAYRRLDAYPEVADVLRRLRSRGIRTAILSNGTPEMLDDAIRSAGLSDLIDATLSIEAAGIYKPDPRIYQLAVDALGVAAPEISFQSSNVWDAAGAASFGFQV
ncbi:MAG: haloacid dehalogenase type II, partial [Alphaproteobacteria bacterium]|nr:haloacid dehalogenase type II [Alphaproteobacteria bacterium]